VSPVKYELGSYIPEDAILHSHCRENLKSYRANKTFNRYNDEVPVNADIRVYSLGVRSDLDMSAFPSRVLKCSL
jgi:hypothetical protein